MKIPPPAALVGLVLLLPAGATSTGWILHERSLVALLPGAVMVLNTALCFILVALALAGDTLPPDSRRRLHTIIGSAVAAIAALVIVEYMTGIGFGIDWPQMHRWYSEGNPIPGRMSRPAAIGFLLCGATLLLMHRVRGLKSGICVQCLTALVIAVGVLGVVGQMLQLPLVYRKYLFGGMALTTASGLIVCGAGLWLSWRRDEWYRARNLVLRSEQRIVLNGTVVLAIVLCGSVLAGLVVMERHADQLARSDRLQILRSRVDLFRVNVELHATRAALVATRPNLLEQLAILNARPADAVALARLRKAADSLLPWGFSALAFRDAYGRELVSLGRSVAAPEIAVELRSRYPVTLMWDGAYVMRSRTPMLLEGAVVGFMSAEQRLPVLTASMQTLDTETQSAEIAVCSRTEERFDCFPQRFVAYPFSLPYSPALPIAHALAGETGALVARDYRGENVLAAHGPIGGLGLGMVVKIDTSELYAPLRASLYTVLAILSLLLAAGIWMLYRSVIPLARELAASEERLQLALEGSGLALWDWDTHSNLVFLSEQWEEMLGRTPRPTAVPLAELQALVHPDDGKALASQLGQVLRGTRSRYDIEHRVRTATGGWKWIRSRGEIVARASDGRAMRLVGTNADISARKAAELQLVHRASHDALTGLPNRSLFADRLEQAVARARRNKTLMALMYLDIDKFKTVNDTMGHDTGDLLLKEFSVRLAACVRNTDTAARLGGDEFVVILESLASREDGLRIAEKIVASMRPDFVLGERALAVTTSAGIAFREMKDGLDGDALLKMADEALYRAKATGRNNFQVAA